MVDLKSTYAASSYYDNNWKDPRLTGPRGVHQHGSQPNKPQWWETTFPNKEVYEVGTWTFMKRGEGHLGQFPTAIRVQYWSPTKGW